MDKRSITDWELHQSLNKNFMDMNKEEAKDALIELYTNQVFQIAKMTNLDLRIKDSLLKAYEGLVVDLTMITKIELGDDVIKEIQRLKGIIHNEEL